MRKSVHSSINHHLANFYKWTKFNQCVACSTRVQGLPWCTDCHLDLPAWGNRKPRQLQHVDKVHIGYEFSYPLDKLIHIAKARGDFRLLVALGGLMPALRVSNSRTMVYPVPIAKWQLLRRGFNQAAILAQEVCAGTATPVDEVSIYKHLFRPRQSSLDKAHRIRNARYLFGIKADTVARHAIIVDDVVTTGATVSAIAKILREHGAETVEVIALAGVP